MVRKGKKEAPKHDERILDGPIGAEFEEIMGEMESLSALNREIQELFRRAGEGEIGEEEFVEGMRVLREKMRRVSGK